MTIESMTPQRLAAELERLRPQLMTYLTRLVVRVAIAEELVQTVAVHALEAIDRAPGAPDELRPWLFRIATNLAIDERRRHGSWREALMLDAPGAIHERADLMEQMRALRGSPETTAVAREHLVTCFACTLGQLPSEQAVALLLREVYGFTTDEVADVLEARFAQVKHWLQAARATMTARFAETCALINKHGVCHQCVQLDQFFEANRGSPLVASDDSMRVRLTVLQHAREVVPGPWARLLGDLLAEL